VDQSPAKVEEGQPNEARRGWHWQELKTPEGIPPRMKEDETIMKQNTLILDSYQIRAFSFQSYLMILNLSVSPKMNSQLRHSDQLAQTGNRQQISLNG